MDTKIFKNSYVILVISFIALYIIFYLFGIGYTTEVKDGKIVKKASWKYPLAISLFIWILWHFYVYPPPEEINANLNTQQKIQQSTSPFDYKPNGDIFEPTRNISGGSMRNQTDVQRINMINWT